MSHYGYAILTNTSIILKFFYYSSFISIALLFF